MEYTQEQKTRFKLVYSGRRRRQLMLTAPVVLLVLGASMMRDGRTDTFFGLSPEIGGPAFLALMIAAVAFSFRNWRCPACDKYLGRNFHPRHCPSCGIALHGD